MIGMVEPIAHYLIPTLILLALVPGVDRKLILLLSPLAVLPDLDFFIGHLYIFHNLIFVIGIPILLYFYFKDRKTSLIAFFFLFSHLLLDTFGPGVGFFYPFYPRLFRFDFFLYTSPAKPSIGGLSYTAATMRQALTEATKDQRSPVVTSFGVVLSGLILFAAILKKSIDRE